MIVANVTNWLTEKFNKKMTNNQIPFLDLHRQYDSIKSEVNSAMQRVMDRQFFILGPETEAFEKELAAYLHVKYVVTVNSGTDALIFSLRALGIGKGDEVITPAHSFIATTLAITELGANPVFVDINPQTLEMDETAIEQKITDRTKAILPVHLYGAPVQIETIINVAKKHNLYVVEDTAQAIGATFKEQKLGTFGDMGTYSFYPGKNLGAYGDGGAVSTNDETLYHKLLKLRNYGQTKKYVHDSVGINSRMDEIQAAVLRVKLKHIDLWNKRRQEKAHLYNQFLQGIKTQKIIHDGQSNYHLFVIEHEKRDELQQFLAEKGIQTLIHYPIPIHLQKCYDYLGHQKGSFEHTEKVSDTVLSLPMYPELTDEEIQLVVKAIHEFNQ